MAATVDPSAAAAYSAAIQRLGLAVTFQRVIGAPPTVTLSPLGGAIVTAIVRNVTPDTTETAATGYPASSPGALGQADREVIVMAQDLAAAGFPLPLQCGDQILLSAADGGETLSVTRPDRAKRKIAGVVTCEAVGIG